MRTYWPVQILVVLLAVGGLVTVSTPSGIGDVIVRTPIILTNAVAQVIRAVADSAAKVSPIKSPRRNEASAAPRTARPAAPAVIDVAYPGRPAERRNPETIRLSGASMAPAGVMVAGATRPAVRDRGKARIGTAVRKTIKPVVVKAVRQHRREIEQRHRSRIPPRFAPVRPRRPPSIRPLHRS